MITKKIPILKKNSLTLISHNAHSVINFKGPLIQCLRKAGLNLRVLAPDWCPHTKKAAKVLGVKTAKYTLSRTGLSPIKDIHTALQLLQDFKKYPADIVLSYAAKTNVWGMIAAAVAKVPQRVAMVEGMGYVFTETGGMRTIRGQFLKMLLATLYRLAFRCAHRVVVNNTTDAKDLQRFCGLPTQKMFLLVGIGVPLKEWPLHPPHASPITFTLISRLLKEKGIMEYLKAARIVKVAYPTVKFYLLGGLDENPGAIREADIQAWLDDGTVDWPGQVNVKPWLAKTSVFVLPSYREGVPRSTQEAMAMGRPVITTNAPGCRETVVDGINGYMVPPRDVSALADAMIKFVKDPALIGRMGLESRRLAEERFDMQKANQKLMGVLGIRIMT
jgi:glycosyltransferase involved in cell wall biosynthesis